MSAQVSSEELHTPTVDPSTLNIAPGVELNETERKHVAIVLDLFKAKGTMAKLKDNFVQEAVYEDPFALSGGLEQFGALSCSPICPSTFLLSCFLSCFPLICPAICTAPDKASEKRAVY